MRHICTFLCLFLLSGVLSSYANASYPPYYRYCYGMIHDPVLWNNGQPPNTKDWTPHCWLLVYYELGRWHFDRKMYEKKMLEVRQRIEWEALQEERKKVWLSWAEQRIVHQMKYGKYNSW